MFRKVALVTAFLGMTALAPGVAKAVTITQPPITPGAFTLKWFLAGNGTTVDDLSAEADVTVAAFSNSSITLDFAMKNTTVLNLLANAGITSFGIAVEPNATSVSFNSLGGGAFTNAILQTGQQNFPGGFKQIDVCVFTQGCSGGSQGSALAAGATDTFRVIIGGNFSGGSVTLTPFPIKFQTSAGSYEFAECTEGPCGGGSNEVPEPGTLLLLGSGLAGFAVLRWRKNKAKA